MHFLVDFVETKYPELLSLNKDMPSVTDAGKGLYIYIFYLLIN